MYHQFKELAEVDITRDAMEVGPTLHYFMGGIRVDADTQQTSVPGLFAAGECSGGMHGANRLGGNSLSDLIVFGWLAGIGAKAYIDDLDSAPEVDAEQVVSAMRKATDILNREDGENPYLVHEAIQDAMHDGVNIIREAEGLQKALDALEVVKERAAKVKAHGASQFNPGWHEALSLSSLLVTAEAVARAALLREESRGAHTRLDFEGEQSEWSQVNIVIRKGPDGAMQVEKAERGEDPAELASIARATLEELEGANG